MTKLCKDCKHCLWHVPNVSATEEFFADDGPWCREALSRLARPADRTNGGFQPFNYHNLDAANVMVQRSVPLVFDFLSGSCGARARWFQPKESE